ncbi:uncharacterized protein EAE97_002379 [Botrytis byssoidea]|uniref:Uncharacterized protein n=1 Tax=Botrytis byssoidea TaxID=139641 RepID=A0A9P5IR14_9HELO|nr:uncharacterized protein EAE97_002379 [Botrytis byssoidea]KAF7950827.1 hypothetical protein EAE97_002379 [Botrytis byssoidea]
MAQPQQANNPAAFIPIDSELEYSGTFPDRILAITFQRNGGDDILDPIKQYTLITDRVEFRIDFTQLNNFTQAERAIIEQRISKIRVAINYVAPDALPRSNKISTVWVFANMSQFRTRLLKICAEFVELDQGWDLLWQINGGAPQLCYSSENDVMVDLEQIIDDYAHNLSLPNDG